MLEYECPICRRRHRLPSKIFFRHLYLVSKAGNVRLYSRFIVVDKTKIKKNDIISFTNNYNHFVVHHKGGVVSFVVPSYKINMYYRVLKYWIEGGEI